jgi:hypothetical protein
MRDNSLNGRPTTEEIENSLGGIMMGITLVIYQKFGLE